MAVAGTKPKPPGQALNRNKPAFEWTEVVDVPYVNHDHPLPPRPPGTKQWLTWTRRWWDELTRMPHCILWNDMDWRYAYDTAVVKEMFYRASGTLHGPEVRIREKHMGTTWDARRDLRIRYVDAPPEADTTDTVATVHGLRSI